MPIHKKFPLLICCSLALLCSLCYPLFISQLIIFQNEFPKSAADPIPPNLLPIFSKPMIFLGLGSQCLAFSSYDDSYVCKICKANRYQVFSFLEPPPFSFFLSSYLKTNKQKKLERRKKDFTSYLLAFKYLKTQCGLVYLHLDQTNNLDQTLYLIDPFKLSHTFDSNQCLFYIQKKATPLPTSLQNLFKEHKIEQIQSLLQQILAMALYNGTLGLRLKDISPKNIGVCQNSPIWIDPGRIIQDPAFCSALEQKKTLVNLCKSLLPFLQHLDPALATFLQNETERTIKNIPE